LIIGAVLSLCAAMLGACSMNVQQLSLVSQTLPPLKKNLYWFFGLILYLISQLVSVAALGYAPLAIVAALFTMMLFFDVVIARVILKKRFTFQHYCGVLVIVLSVTIVGIWGPEDEYDVTAPCMWEWLQTWTGAVSLAFLVAVLISGNILVWWFNRKYPNFRTPQEKTDPGGGPSDPLKLLMMVVFPTCLAIFETFGQMSLKGLVNMAKVPTFEIPDGEAPFDHPMFFVTLGVWIFCVANTVLWLRKVYSKFTTVECLPIEYGLVGVLSIFGSLMFYQEHTDSAVVIEMVTVGCFGILTGIAIMVHGRYGTLHPPETEAERNLQNASAGMRSGNTFHIRQGLRGAWRHAIFIQKLMDGVITQEEYRILVNGNKKFTTAALDDEAREDEERTNAEMAEMMESGELPADDLEDALDGLDLEAGEGGRRVRAGSAGRGRAHSAEHLRTRSNSMLAEDIAEGSTERPWQNPQNAKDRWALVRVKLKPAMRMVLLHKSLRAKKKEHRKSLKAAKSATLKTTMSPKRKKQSSAPPGAGGHVAKQPYVSVTTQWQLQNDPVIGGKKTMNSEVTSTPPLHYGNLFTSLCEKKQEPPPSVPCNMSVGIV
jgi:hypothetical protein